MITNNKPDENPDISKILQTLKRRNKNRINILIGFSVCFLIIILIYGINIIQNISEFGFHKYVIGDICDIVAIGIFLFLAYKSIKIYKKRDYSVSTLQLLETMRKDYTLTTRTILRIIILLGLLNVKYFFLPNVHYTKILFENLIPLVLVFIIYYFHDKPKYNEISRLIKELED